MTDPTNFPSSQNDPGETEGSETDPGDIGVETLEAIAEARRRLAEAPADVVVTNHAMGLYELAAIHLSNTPPHLPSAALAIDALACLVEGLGERLGDDHAVLRDALGNIRMAFVQVKNALEP